MSVSAKFRCVSKKECAGGGPDGSGMWGIEVVLQPVYSSDPNDPNYSWSKATPSGEIKMTITNPAAYDQFKTGKLVDITLTTVE